MGEDLKGMGLPALVAYFEALGEPRYRAEQVFAWIHKQGVRSFDEMTSLSKALRESLGARAHLGGLRRRSVLRSVDGTRKIVCETTDGHAVETVLIPDGDRMTQCISSQVGCRIGCTFCLTATMPIRRDLTASEILDQVLHAQEVLSEEGGRITNIVYMGMGEPLDNLEPVIASGDLLMHPSGQGFSPRRITVSTSGLPKQMLEFCERSEMHLALSLNAADDATRDAVIPINRKYPIQTLLDAIVAIPRAGRRRVTVEYVLLGGTNDGVVDARRLAGLVKSLGVRVNLIPFNPYPGAIFQRPEPGAVDAFGRVLRDAGITVTVRTSRGQDIGAACGMLDGVEASDG
jgi:23S rRNA (adenine2503-C2)-methyltransferase